MPTPDSASPSSPLTIDFEPLGRRVSAHPGKTLLSAAQEAGVELVALCGGAGLCASCRVRLMNGELSPLTLDEKENLSAGEIQGGMRLACQAHPLSNVKIHVPPESLTTPQRLQVESLGVSASVDDPVVSLVDIRMPPPTLDDQRSDELRLIQALSPALGREIEIESGLLGELSNLLRDYDWHCAAALANGRVTALLPPHSHPLGAAVDLGTTKIAMYLLDLQSGAILAKKGMMNPQISYGEDVISRIAYTEAEPGGRRTLQSRLVETLNQMTAELCAEAGVETGQVVAAVAVGNTVMHHLFAGLPVKQLSLVPFVPAVSQPLELPAAGLGWKLAPGAPVYLPANIAGYVGADHVAMALATGIYQSHETMLALDIGTNTEISLIHDGKMRCCSCASGPAFEGAHIRHGMRASNGAIERVQILEGQVKVHTIGNQPPVGLCGSGILDVVASLRKTGMIKESGAFVAGMPGVANKEFILVERENSGTGQEITIQRRDINEIALAKGAIRTGIDILLRAAGLSAPDIQHFVIAGAFGSYLDIESAIIIRMFPDIPRSRFSQVGNAAGLGAQMMLVSASRRAAARDFARRMEYIELTSQPDFQDVFVRSLYF